MSDWEKRYKRPYQNNSKVVRDGTLDKVLEMRKEGYTFTQIGELLGKSRQQISQIFYKSIANEKKLWYNNKKSKKGNDSNA